MNQVLIDFGDQESFNVTLIKNSENIVSKIYKKSGTFRINAFLIGTPLNSSAQITSKKIYFIKI